jgi:hypothetical protein
VDADVYRGKAEDDDEDDCRRGMGRMRNMDQARQTI